MKIRQKALDEAQAAHDKAATVVSDLKEKLHSAQAQRADEEDMLDGGSESREQLKSVKVNLEAQSNALQKALYAYSDNDPTELLRKRKEIERYRREAEQYTDEVHSMEGWFRSQGQDAAGITALRTSLYGDEYDAEEGIIKELD